jgi:hypothetical protein
MATRTPCLPLLFLLAAGCAGAPGSTDDRSPLPATVPDSGSFAERVRGALVRFRGDEEPARDGTRHADGMRSSAPRR